MESIQILGVGVDVWRFLNYSLMAIAHATSKQPLDKKDRTATSNHVAYLQKSTVLLADAADLEILPILLRRLVEQCCTLSPDLTSALAAAIEKSSTFGWKIFKPLRTSRKELPTLLLLQQILYSLKSQLQREFGGDAGAQFIVSLNQIAIEHDAYLVANATLETIEAKLQSVLETCHESEQDDKKILNAFLDKIKEIRLLITQYTVLKALKIQGINERFDSITKAGASTYTWIFDGDAESTEQHEALIQARKRFQKWLREETGFFYVSGKPGAGKSTLMKFISCHDGFARLTRQWCDGSIPLSGRFFFWKPGRPEQKTIDGLLRGLLYSILQEAPAVVSIAFAEYYQSSSRLAAMTIEAEDIRLAFENILQHSLDHNTYKFILTIDGLDEFEGDHRALLEMMRDWTIRYSNNIKICVSSREYGVFEDFFAESPKLRLHELTKNDMMQLTNTRLGASKLFASLAENEQMRIKILIASKAEGVFLWVIMMLATIEDGFIRGDVTNVTSLERIIGQCPNELDDLLPHLLKSVTESHRVWAYRAISLVLFAQFKMPELLHSSQTNPGVGLLEILLLDEAASRTWNLANFQPRSEVKSEQLSERLEKAKGKVIRLCRGFLAVVTISSAETWPANGDDERMYVVLSHRSIVEFLTSIQAQTIMKPYLSQQVEPFTILLSTILACLRFLPPTNYPLLKELPQSESENLTLAELLEDSLQDRWRDMIRCSLSLGLSGSPRFLNLLDAIGDAIKRQLTIQLSLRGLQISTADRSPDRLLATTTLGNRVFEYSEWLRRRGVRLKDANNTPSNKSELAYAFSKVIHHFESVQTDSIDSDGPKSRRRSPLDWLRRNSFINIEPTISKDRLQNLLVEFIETGMDPNWTWTPHRYPGAADIAKELLLDGKPWTSWQSLVWAMMVGYMPYPERYACYIDYFLRNGADPDLVLFCISPANTLHLQRLSPANGWVLLVPYLEDIAKLDGYLQRTVDTTDEESSQKLARMPIVLVRDTSPIYQCTRGNSWKFTLSDLLDLWFPHDREHFSSVAGSLKVTSRDTNMEEPNPISRNIDVNLGHFGPLWGTCDLEAFVKEQKNADESSLIHLHR